MIEALERGKETETVIIEPLEEPVPREEPAPERKPERETEPELVPA